MRCEEGRQLMEVSSSTSGIDGAEIRSGHGIIQVVSGREPFILHPYIVNLQLAYRQFIERDPVVTGVATNVTVRHHVESASSDRPEARETQERAGRRESYQGESLISHVHTIS